MKSNFFTRVLCVAIVSLVTALISSGAGKINTGYKEELKAKPSIQKIIKVAEAENLTEKELSALFLRKYSFKVKLLTHFILNSIIILLYLKISTLLSGIRLLKKEK